MTAANQNVQKGYHKTQGRLIADTQKYVKKRLKSPGFIRFY